MKKTFVNSERALLTVMLQCEIPETAIRRIRNSLYCGAEAFGFQAESLKKEYQNAEVYKRIIDEMRGKPAYVTYYRRANTADKTDDELAEGLLTLAECGATLCDITGDMFDAQPNELTMDEEAVETQVQLIEQLHDRGAEVLMSSHVLQYIPAEQVLNMAFEHKRRGVDIVKIVTGAETMEQQIENLRTTHLLKKELGIPFLFLSVGECSMHRREGAKLGNCMELCVYEHDELSAFHQPLLSVSKIIRENMEL